MTRLFKTLSLSALCLSFSASAFADDIKEKDMAPKAMSGKEAKAQAKATGLAKRDIEFLEMASQIGMTEVEAGKLTRIKASEVSVKTHGETMIADHTANNTELGALAAQKGVSLSATLDKKHQGMIDELEKSKSFDKDYAKAMEAGHKEAIALFEKEGKKTKDADIKAFVEKTLPTLHTHEASSESVKAEVKKSK